VWTQVIYDIPICGEEGGEDRRKEKGGEEALMCSCPSGGNDVAMIQEAALGVGIVGREGLQAARASDYCFGKFKFLRRLLFVHGNFSYTRTSFVGHYCFHKSLYIALIQV
jgi:P-type E1-E2 ATPase